MVGTLTVQNLQGPASGANANKVIIPSGHTLDASGGTLVPSAGAVVQVVQVNNPASGHISTTALSEVASGIIATITPKYSDSLIIVDFVSGMAVGSGGDFRASMWMSVGASPRVQAPNSGVYSVGYRSAGSEYGPLMCRLMYYPADTSSLTFEPYWRCISSGIAYLVHGSSSYSLTLTEIKQ